MLQKIICRSTLLQQNESPLSPASYYPVTSSLCDLVTTSSALVVMQCIPRAQIHPVIWNNHAGDGGLAEWLPVCDANSGTVSLLNPSLADIIENPIKIAADLQPCVYLLKPSLTALLSHGNDCQRRSGAQRINRTGFAQVWMPHKAHGMESRVPAWVCLSDHLHSNVRDTHTPPACCAAAAIASAAWTRSRRNIHASWHDPRVRVGYTNIHASNLMWVP